MMQRRARRPGFTVIELMVVVAIVAVLAALATPSLRAFASNQALSSTASDLLSATMTARSTAISRNRPTIIEPMDMTAGWTSGWRVYVDNDASGDFDAAEDELISESSAVPEGIVLTAGTANCTRKDRFAYRADGFLKWGEGAFSNGGIQFKSTVTSRERCVVINKVGRGRICGNDIDACSSS